MDNKSASSAGSDIMGNDGISIRIMSRFGSDQKMIPAILGIINSAKVVCIDKPFCDETLQQETTKGRVFIIEKDEDQKQTAIGVVLAHTIIKNSFGIFSIAFEKSMRNNQEIIASAIESFKECAFKEMRLSLITLMVSNGDGLPGILLKKNFVNGIDKTITDFYSISNNGSVLTKIKQSDSSGEAQKPDEVYRMAYEEISKLKSANARLTQELAKAVAEAQNKKPAMGENQSSRIAELEEQLKKALEKYEQAQKKFNEWHDNKNQQLEEAQKTIADRDTTIKRLDGEIIELSKLLGEKTQKVNELTKTTDKPSEPAPETNDPYKEIEELITIVSPDEQAEKIHKLIEKRLKEKNLSRNSLRIANLAAAFGIIIISKQQQATVTDLAERMQCTTATVRSLAKELEALGIAEKHKHSVKLKKSSGKTAEKNLAKEKKSLADVKLVPRDLQILQIIIESGKNGIFQQEIIKKTGIPQPKVSLAVRILTDKKLVKNQQVGIRSKAIAQMEEIQKQLPEMIKSTEQLEPEKTEEKTAETKAVHEPPKLPEIKTEPETHEVPQPTEMEPDKKPKPILTLLLDPLTYDETKLLESFPKHKILQIADYINDCLDNKQEIKLSIICGKLGAKKNQSRLLASALVKSMNKETDNPNDRIKAVKIGIDENDFENSTIELLGETKFLNELEKDKPPQEKPAEIKPEQPVEKMVTMNELREKLQDESNVNGTDIAEKPKRTLAQLKATSGLCDKQKEILEKLNDAGGSLKKKKIREIFRITDITLTPYLDFMAKLDVIKVDRETISLKF